MDNKNISKVLKLMADLLLSQIEDSRAQAYYKAAVAVEGSKLEIDKNTSLLNLKKINGVGPVIASEIKEHCNLKSISFLTFLLYNSEIQTVLQSFGLSRLDAEAVIEGMNLKSYEHLRLSYRKGYVIRFLGKDSSTYQKIKLYMDTYIGIDKKKLDELVGVEDLLNIDKEFRSLRTFSPEENKSWLVTKKGITFLVSYSMSDTAYKSLGYGDWVNIKADLRGDAHWTVLTGGYVSYRNKRIVIGREKETKDFYGKLINEEPLLSE